MGSKLEEIDKKSFYWSSYIKGDKIIKVFKNKITKQYVFINRNDIKKITWSVGTSFSMKFSVDATLLCVKNKRKDAIACAVKYMRMH